MQNNDPSIESKTVSSFRAPSIAKPFETKKMEGFAQVENDLEDSQIEEKRLNIFTDLEDYHSKSKGLKMFKKL